MQSDSDPQKYKRELQQFKKSIKVFTNDEYEDEFLLRWINGADGDLDNAEDKLIQYLNFRKFFRAEHLPEEYVIPEVFKKYVNSYVSFLGFDKNDAAVIYFYIGNADAYGLIRIFSAMEIIRYSLYFCEKIAQEQREKNKRAGKKSDIQLTAIYDYDHFSLDAFSDKDVRENGLASSKMFLELYPGSVNRVFCINAPGYIEKPFNVLIKPIIKSAYLQRFSFCAKGQCADELLKYIDADVLPVSLGGTRVDENGDPNCSTLLKSGSVISPEDYVYNSKILKHSDQNVSVISIPAGASEEVGIKIREPNSKFRLEFCSDESIYIQFIFHKTRKTQNIAFVSNKLDAKEIPLTPLIRMNSHLAPEDFICHAPDAGIYLIRFDNSSSWMTSIEVIYRIQLLPPSAT